MNLKEGRVTDRLNELETGLTHQRVKPIRLRKGISWRSPIFLSTIGLIVFVLVGGIYLNLIYLHSPPGGKTVRTPIRSPSGGCIQPNPGTTQVTSPTQTDETKDWHMYKSSMIGIEIKYPSNLKVVEYGKGLVVFTRETTRFEELRGMIIYYRNAASKDRGIDIANRPLEETMIAGYPAVRVTDNPPYTDSIWIYSCDRKKVIRVELGDNPPFEQHSFETFHRMLSTIRFLD